MVSTRFITCDPSNYPWPFSRIRPVAIRDLKLHVDELELMYNAGEINWKLHYENQKSGNLHQPQHTYAVSKEHPPTGVVSYFLCSLIKNPEEEDPPRRICTRCFEGGPLPPGSWPPDPMNQLKILKGQPRRYALSELVQAWYKIFPPDHFGQVKINVSTMFRNKTSTHKLVWRIRFWSVKSLEQHFKYLYWTIIPGTIF